MVDGEGDREASAELKSKGRHQDLSSSSLLSG